MSQRSRTLKAVAVTALAGLFVAQAVASLFIWVHGPLERDPHETVPLLAYEALGVLLLLVVAIIAAGLVALFNYVRDGG